MYVPFMLTIGVDYLDECSVDVPAQGVAVLKENFLDSAIKEQSLKLQPIGIELCVVRKPAVLVYFQPGKTAWRVRALKKKSDVVGVRRCSLVSEFSFVVLQARVCRDSYTLVALSLLSITEVNQNVQLHALPRTLPYLRLTRLNLVSHENLASHDLKARPCAHFRHSSQRRVPHY